MLSNNSIIPRRKWLAAASALALTAVTLPVNATEKQKVVIGQSSRNFDPGLSNMWIGTQIGLYGPNLDPETGEPRARRESPTHVGRQHHPYHGYAGCSAECNG